MARRRRGGEVSETPCVTDSCPYPAFNALICRICSEQLVRDLEGIPELSAQLDITLARQARMTGQSGSRSAVRPVMFDPRASECAYLLRSTLAGRVSELLDGTHVEATSAPELATWLLTRFDDLARHPD